MTFQIKIAGICFRINSIFDAIYKKCREYLDEGSLPEFTIELRQFDYEKEIKLLKIDNWILKLPSVEVAAIYRKIVEILLTKNVLLMHGSTVAIGNAGIIFTAPSGTGKTTRSRLWVDQISECYILNGDKPLIECGDRFLVYGTPWAGKEEYQRNCSAELKVICFLTRDEDNSIRKIEKTEAIQRLINQVYMPCDGDLLSITMCLIGQIANKLPIYDLKCNNFKDNALDIDKAVLLPELMD